MLEGYIFPSNGDNTEAHMSYASYLIPAAIIAVCVIAWLARHRADKRKSAKPDASVKAGPGNTGPGTGSPR